VREPNFQKKLKALKIREMQPMDLVPTILDAKALNLPSLKGLKPESSVLAG
jgi:hypothetical protein